jgi:hypothetical protein
LVILITWVPTALINNQLLPIGGVFMATAKKTTPAVVEAVKKPARSKAPAAAKPVAKSPVVAKAPAAKKAIAKPVAATSKPATKATPKAAAKPVTQPVTQPVAMPATKPATARKAAAVAKRLDPAQRANYVEVAAFYIAERRGFAAANPMDDWLAAEAEIDRLIASGHFGN